MDEVKRYVWVRTITLSTSALGGRSKEWELQATGNARGEDADALTLGGTGDCPFQVGERLTLVIQT